MVKVLQLLLYDAPIYHSVFRIASQEYGTAVEIGEQDKMG